MNDSIWQYCGPIAKIEGGAGSGKTDVLVKRCAYLLQQGTSPEQIVVAVASSFAADRFRERLDVELEGAEHTGDAARVFVARPLDVCVRLLSQPEAQAATGQTPRILTESEYLFFIEDLKTLGQRNQRLANMLMFFYAQWSNLENEADWVIPGEETTVLSLARRLLKEYRGMLRHEAPYLCAKLLQSDEGKSLAGHWDYVLCDDYQNFSFAEQSVMCLCAHKQLMICGNAEETTFVNTDYPSCSGFERFERTRHGAQVFHLESAPQSAEARTLWDNPSAELQAGAKTIEAFLTANKNACASDVIVAVPNKKWGKLVRTSLKQAGYQSARAGLSPKMPGDPRSAGYHGAMSAFFLLNLVADPEDVLAWRAVTGFDNALTNSDVWEHLRKRADEQNIGTFDLFKQVVEHGSDDALVAKRQNELQHVWQQTQAAIAACKDLKGAELAKATGLSNHAEFAEMLTWMQGDEDAIALASLIRNHLNSPHFPKDSNAVRVVLYENLCGLDAPLLIASGMVDGLIPSRKALEPTEMQDKRDKVMEEDRKRLYSALSKSSKHLVLSASAHADLNTAEQLKMQVYRVASVKGVRQAKLQTSQLLNNSSACNASFEPSNLETIEALFA